MESARKDIKIEGFRPFTGEANTTIVYTWEITLLDTDSTPITNLVDGRSKFVIKRSYADETALLTADEDDGITITPAEGKILLELKQSHFSNFNTFIQEQDFVYDWEVIDDDNRKYRLYRGSVTFIGDL